MVFNDGDAFLQQQGIRVGNHFSLTCFQVGMESPDVFDFSFDREVLVVYFDDVANLKGEWKQKNDAGSDVAQNRPLRK